MPTLYFNNFRGFKETFLPLKNMNFFVGENSTGKTSVLKLIKLLSDWILPEEVDFSSSNVELGYFSEIANYGERFFQIGFHNENDRYLSSVILEFIESEGLSFLKKVRLVNFDLNLEIEIDKQDNSVQTNEFRYKYRFSYLDHTESRKINFFRFWAQNNELTTKVYEYADVSSNPKFFFTTLDFFILSKVRKDNHLSNHRSIISRFLDEVVWFAPIRTEPKRTYDSYKKSFNPDGSHIPYILKDLIGSEKNNYSKIRVEEFEEVIQKFGKESGLYDKIEIFAFDKSDTSPFEIRIHINGNPIKITNVGYGISQILPVITEIMSRPRGAWFAIQQPEIHLHPKAQAAFGEFVFSFLDERKNFIIETHSEYVVDRFRLCVNRNRENVAKNVPRMEGQVVFFKRTEKGNELILIPINEDGSYPEDQPKEFQEFFINEQLDLLNI